MKGQILSALKLGADSLYMGGDLLHTRGERSGGDCTSGKERGRCSLPSPRWGFLTPWDTCHAKWAPDPASALQLMGVSGSAESIIYFPCRLKS